MSGRFAIKFLSGLIFFSGVVNSAESQFTIDYPAPDNNPAGQVYQQLSSGVGFTFAHIGDIYSLSDESEFRHYLMDSGTVINGDAEQGKTNAIAYGIGAITKETENSWNMSALWLYINGQPFHNPDNTVTEVINDTNLDNTLTTDSYLDPENHILTSIEYKFSATDRLRVRAIFSFTNTGSSAQNIEAITGIDWQYVNPSVSIVNDEYVYSENIGKVSSSDGDDELITSNDTWISFQDGLTGNSPVILSRSSQNALTKADNALTFDSVYQSFGYAPSSYTFTLEANETKRIVIWLEPVESNAFVDGYTATYTDEGTIKSAGLIDDLNQEILDSVINYNFNASFLADYDDDDIPDGLDTDDDNDGILDIDETIKVLFIGNSYTSSKNVPSLVKQIASSKNINIDVTSVTVGGHKFSQHAYDANTLAAIKQNKWDYVILQNQSQIPGWKPIDVTAQSLPHAEVLVDAIKSNSEGTEVVYYVTWGRENGDSDNCAYYPLVCDFSGHTAAIKRGYEIYQGSTGGMLADVGRAWKSIVDDEKSPFNSADLWTDDGSHPETLGAYLAANVIFNTLFELSTLGADRPLGMPLEHSVYLQQIATGFSADDDGDLLPNEIDIDDDNDGIADEFDQCNVNSTIGKGDSPANWDADNDGCDDATEDFDTDGDGFSEVKQFVTCTLNVSQDSFITSGSNETNYGERTQLVVQHAQTGEYKIYRSLFQVNIDDSQNTAELCEETGQPLPSHISIENALFNVYIQSQDYAVDMHRISNEGTWQENIITWDNQPEYAVESLYSKQWQYDWTDIDLTFQIQRYLDGFDINNGWLFKAHDESAAEYNPYRFFSRESANKPKLTVIFAIGSDDGTDFCGNDALGHFIDTDNDGLCDGTGPDNYGNGGSDTDDDGDGYLNDVDQFPLDKLEYIDTDFDGIGNNADVDDDNDNVDDAFDDFPLDVSESVDTDNDGIGNNTDTDDDNDGVIDELDGEPLNPTVGDIQRPLFAELETITVNAHGRLTDISKVINVVAEDAVDGAINAAIVGEMLYLSGQHTLTLSATDSAGNSDTAQQRLIILPEVSVIAKTPGQAGGTYSVGINLGGESPNYPVEVLYNLYLNGEVYDEAWLNINSGTQSAIAINVAENLTNQDVISVSLEFATSAFIGDQRQGQVVLSDNNFAPQLTLSLVQGGERVSVIDPNNGMVTLWVEVEDINPNDTHHLAWTVKDAAFTDANLDGDTLSFEIDPAQLAEGSYVVNVIATESNTTDGLLVSQNIQLVVEQLAMLTRDTDSDNDGINDIEEGYSDTDGDGIVDYLDDNSNPTELPSSDNTAPMQTAPGLTMALGSIVRTASGSATENASLTLEALVNAVGEEAAETQTPDFEAATPLYNFTIGGLSEQGDSVAVIIPLASGTSLPEGAVYRKYNTKDGWYTFVENENNSVSSAKADLNGNCPAANDDNYALGLTVGDNCIQLIIEDGGENDADFEINGSVEDPGAVMIASPTSEPINTEPVVNIDSHQASFDEGSQVTISSQASDPENDNLNYQWVQLTGPAVSFDDTTAAVVNITLPYVVSDEVIELQVTVSDGELSALETTTFKVTNIVETVVEPAIIAPVKKKKSSGGSTSDLYLFLFLMACFRKGKQRKQ